MTKLCQKQYSPHYMTALQCGVVSPYQRQQGMFTYTRKQIKKLLLWILQQTPNLKVRMHKRVRPGLKLDLVQAEFNFTKIIFPVHLQESYFGLFFESLKVFTCEFRTSTVFFFFGKNKQTNKQVKQTLSLIQVNACLLLIMVNSLFPVSYSTESYRSSVHPTLRFKGRVPFRQD